MSKYKAGDMYAPKSIFMAVAQMASIADPVRKIYEALRKNPTDFNAPRKISMVYEEKEMLYLEGIPVSITFDAMRGLFNPVFIAEETSIPDMKGLHINPANYQIATVAEAGAPGPAYMNMVKMRELIETNVCDENNVASRERSTVLLSEFFRVAHRVQKRTVSDVVHHLSAEVGEISECLVQPHRNGNIVEESVDAIICALDVIYLSLRQTHGTSEIAEVINKLMDTKLAKWYDTCKPTE